MESRESFPLVRGPPPPRGDYPPPNRMYGGRPPSPSRPLRPGNEGEEPFFERRNPHLDRPPIPGNPDYPPRGYPPPPLRKYAPPPERRHPPSEPQFPELSQRNPERNRPPSNPPLLVGGEYPVGPPPPPTSSFRVQPQYPRPRPQLPPSQSLPARVPSKPVEQVC